LVTSNEKYCTFRVLNEIETLLYVIYNNVLPTMITRLIISALAVLITAYTLDGVTVEPWWWAILIAIVLGFINSCIRPLVKLLSLPINMLTLGLFTFVINGLMVMLCSWVLRPHFEVDNLGWAMGFSIVLTLVSWLLHLFFPNKK